MELDRFIEPSETAIRVVEIVAAYILVGLFAVGVFDLVVTIFELIRNGAILDPDEGIDQIILVIDKALILFIIVEIYQTVVAYSREESVVRIVIVAALIAVSRKIISFRPSEYNSVLDAFVFAAAVAVLLLVLVAALYVLRTTPRVDTDGTTAGEAPAQDATTGPEEGDGETTRPAGSGAGTAAGAERQPDPDV